MTMRSTAIRRAAIPRALLAGAIALLAGACSVGTGTGQLTGSVADPVCSLDIPDYSMGPTLFTADIIEDPGEATGETRKRLTLRIQRGTYREGDSDGLMIFVPDTNAIARTIQASGPATFPVGAGSGAPVQMTLYLNQTCPSGGPDDYEQIPAIFEAYGGTITFDAIYAPDVAPSETEITATLDGITFLDPERADRMATLSGDFSFQYQRGRPAQNFP